MAYTHVNNTNVEQLGIFFKNIHNFKNDTERIGGELQGRAFIPLKVKLLRGCKIFV